MIKRMITTAFTIGALWANATPNYSLRYWFDMNDGNAVSIESASSNLKQQIDITNLAPGMHSIHIQAIDAEGIASSTSTTYFVRMPKAADANGMILYWFDEDTTPRGTLNNPARAVAIDVSSLSLGMHYLHVQSGPADGPSTIFSSMFMKMPVTATSGEICMVFKVDGKEYQRQKVESNGGIAPCDLSVVDAQPGLHMLTAQIVSSVTGAMSSPHTVWFYRNPTSEELANMQFYCSIDGRDYILKDGTFDEGVYHYDVDVSDCDTGEHEFNFFMSSPVGLMTQTCQWSFINQNAGYGDVNLDGDVTVADVTAIVNLLLSDEGYNVIGDVDADGALTVADITALINLLLEQ